MFRPDDPVRFLFACTFAAIIFLCVRSRTLALVCAVTGMSFLVLYTEKRLKPLREPYMDNIGEQGLEEEEGEGDAEGEEVAYEEEEEEYADEVEEGEPAAGEGEEGDSKKNNAPHSQPWTWNLDGGDDELLFYGEYSSGPTYARHRAQLTQQQHWRCLLEGQFDADADRKPRDRMARVWPRVSIYRDRTGQTSRFNYLS